MAEKSNPGGRPAATQVPLVSEQAAARWRKEKDAYLSGSTSTQRQYGYN